MKNIQTELENAIRNHPEKSYRVLIITKDGSDVSKLNLEDAKKLMDNIISAELKGSKILSIAKKSIVESIELDSEMTIT
ncbi:MAG: hypothetical protein GVY07_01095 [Bacteroidetes bacterium]|jgi:hypothetical protein|nr:hypothetical protein [Bacteroidota bacterium]